MKDLLWSIMLISASCSANTQDRTLFFPEIHRSTPDDETDWEHIVQDSLVVKIDQKRSRYQLHDLERKLLVNCRVLSLHNQLVRSGTWNAYNNQGKK